MTRAPYERGRQTELLDAALDSLEEGFVVLDAEGHVAAWNPAATRATGFQRGEMLGRPLPEGFYEIDATAGGEEDDVCSSPLRMDGQERPLAVNLRHSKGHALPAMLRMTALRDALGHRFGTLIRFHPTEEMDVLPFGATYNDEDLDSHAEHNVVNIEERLGVAWGKWERKSVPFGLLWVLVDQAQMLLKTHGRDASEAMLKVVERTLSHALRPGEILGRWGHHEFLVLCHERSAELLLLQARHMCELTHSADFRWWGDRVPLTVSIGAAQAEKGETLKAMMLRAQQAMERARLDGGSQAALSKDEKKGESSPGYE